MNWNWLLDEFKKLLRNYDVYRRYGTKAPKGEKEVFEFYGNPADYPSPEKYWSQAGKFVFVNRDAYAHIPFLHRHGGFWANKAIAKMLGDIFAEIAEKGLAVYVTSFDGCYNHRLTRGSSRLSLHALGAAVDINALTNPLGSKGNQDQRIVEVFEDHQWTWGGHWKSRPDPMHFAFGSWI